MKAKIEAGEQPWAEWFEKAKSSGYATQSPHGTTSLDGGDDGQANPAGEDASASYVLALLYQYSGETDYADRAMKILNSWAGLEEITTSRGEYDQQNLLQAGWMGAEFGPAAELLRSYMSDADRASLQAMFKKAFYPLLKRMSTWNGNVDLTQIDAMMSIAVFNDDDELFQEGIVRLKARMPAYFYLESDGPTPAPIDGCEDAQQCWANPTKWISGLTQETCRDNGHHAQYALGSACMLPRLLGIRGWTCLQIMRSVSRQPLNSWLCSSIQVRCRALARTIRPRETGMTRGRLATATTTTSRITSSRRHGPCC